MAANIYGLHQFADDVGPLPLKLLDDSYSTLSIALNTLATFSNFYSDTGTTNAYTIQSTQYQLVVYSDGLEVSVRIANTNTGASTLNINGLGAVPILTSIGSELQPNALVAGSIVNFIYNAQRQAWQISSGGSGGGQITAPLHVTNPTGQSALSINPDGSGYLGDFNGNGLSWDAACHFTFEGGATLAGIQPDFRINTVVPASAGEPQLELRADGYSGITAWPSGTAVNLEANGGGALGTPPCQLEWDANCNWIFGGDSKVTIPNVALGTAPNQILIDSNGNLTTTGTATLPMPPLIDLPGINITNPQNGEALVYDSATNSWVNGAPVNALATLNDVALSNPLTGQTLTYNAVTQRWVNSPPVLALEGLTNAHISGPASGQVLTYSMNPQPGWVNATIPGYTFLSNLGVGPNPQAGWVLTWDGQAWVGAAPGQVATFPLSSLTDVGITTPLNRQVLTYDAPSGKWINAPAPSPSLATLPDVSLTAQTQGQVLAWDATLNRWVNSALPGGSVIALDTLMDVNVSDPQNNQVLTWDYASARWVNRALPAGFTPVFTNPAAGQVLSYNGTNWVNAAPVTALANLSDVTLTTPAEGQMLVYDAPNHRWVNNRTVSGPFTVSSTTATLSVESGGATFAITPDPVSGVNGVKLATSFAQGGSGPIKLSPGGNDVMDVFTNGSVAINSTGAAFSIVPDPTSGANGVNLITSFAQGGSGPIKLSPGGNNTMVVASTGTAITAPVGFLLSVANTQPATIGNIAALRMGVVNNFSGIEYASIQAICENAGNAQVGLGLYTNPATSNAGTERVRISSVGNVTVHPPSAVEALTILGAANNTTVRTTAGWNTTGGVYALIVQDVSSNIGCSNGIYIRAGTNTGDSPLWIDNAAQSLNYFRVDGGGNVYLPQIGAAGGGTQVMWSSNGSLFRTTSAARFKTNVRALRRNRVRETVAKLRAIRYNSLCEADRGTEYYGLIAEEVAVIDSALVSRDQQGNPSSVQYDRIAMLLLPLVQELLGMDEPEGEVYG